MAQLPQLAVGIALVGTLFRAPQSSQPQPPARQAKVLVLYGVRPDDPFHRRAAAMLHRRLEATGLRVTLSDEFVDDSSRAASLSGRPPQSVPPRDYLAAKYRDSTFDLIMP